MNLTQSTGRCHKCDAIMVRTGLITVRCPLCSSVRDTVDASSSDPVNPSHYVKRGIEVRHVIRAFECSYNIGTAVAYLLRAPFKKDYIEDLRKAAMHIQFELEDRGGEATKTTTKGIP